MSKPSRRSARSALAAAPLMAGLGLAAVAASTASADAPPVAGVVAPTTATLEIKVANVRNARGRVHVDICTARQFLKDCPYSAEAPAVRGTTTVRISNLPAGAYAAQAFHDENTSGEVERNFMGIPKEGVGFSRIGHVLLRAPKFAEAAFSYDGSQASVPVQIHYYLR